MARRGPPQWDLALRITARDKEGGELYISPDSRDRGGTGRRASLRSWWGNPWGFESLRSHLKQTGSREWGVVPGGSPDRTSPHSPLPIPVRFSTTCLTFS